MKRFVIIVFLLFALWGGNQSWGAPLRFEKVSDHCYYLQLKESGDNVAVVVTDEGILVVDPPSEPDLTPTVEALKRVSLKPVRWVVFSNPRSARTGGGGRRVVGRRETPHYIQFSHNNRCRQRGR
jgi:hypothetical protein